MTLRRILPLIAAVGAAGTAVAVFLRRRRREPELPTFDSDGKDYEVRDGVIDLTGVATQEQVPDVIKGVAEVPGSVT